MKRLLIAGIALALCASFALLIRTHVLNRKPAELCWAIAQGADGAKSLELGILRARSGHIAFVSEQCPSLEADIQIVKSSDRKILNANLDRSPIPHSVPFSIVKATARVEDIKFDSPRPHFTIVGWVFIEPIRSGEDANFFFGRMIQERFIKARRNGDKTELTS